MTITITPDLQADLESYLALVVDEYGEAYYSIFERFESELQIAEEREQKIKARLHSFK